MTKLELARKCAEIGDTQSSKDAYTLALKENKHKDSLIDLECAMYILQFGGDYKLSFDTFVYLYNKGLYQEDIFNIMVTAFYEPNMSKQVKQYKSNITKLSKYKLIFNKNFIPFDELKIKFFPYDNNHFIPFYTEENRFGEKINFNHEEVVHNFFNNLDNPILAEDIYSQYELEYLNDNVRKSEWVGRENHIYLHYTNFDEFCSYMQVINFAKMLNDEKLVFLIENEIEMYPIDFKEKFNIDYSQYPVKPINIREIHKLIWSVQVSAGNGGDFFNEVFDSHPNILLTHSTMFSSFESLFSYKNNNTYNDIFFTINESDNDINFTINLTPYLNKYKKNITEKDIIVAFALAQNDYVGAYDKESRIVPAVYIQPHFGYFRPQINYDEKGMIEVKEEMERTIVNSSFAKQFKYIKTFAPLRSITVSYGCSMRFQTEQVTTDSNTMMSAWELPIRCLMKNYMISKSERIYKDCRLVRFEDGKLNPEATFTALANFLDVPYTDSMKNCSRFGKIDACSWIGKTFQSAVGFDPAPVYKTYDHIIDPAEKYILEYMQQKAYREYKYNYEYYDGSAMTEEKIDELIKNCHKYKRLYYDMMKQRLMENNNNKKIVSISRNATIFYVVDTFYETEEERLADIEKHALNYYNLQMKKLKEVLMTVDPNAKVVDKNGEEKVFMKLLEPIEELMVAPLYH